MMTLNLLWPSPAAEVTPLEQCIAEQDWSCLLGPGHDGPCIETEEEHRAYLDPGPEHTP